MTKQEQNGNTANSSSIKQRTMRDKLSQYVMDRLNIWRQYGAQPLENRPAFLEKTLAQLETQQQDLQDAMNDSETVKGFKYAGKAIKTLIDRCEAEYLKQPCDSEKFKILDDRRKAIQRADMDSCKQSLFYAIASCSRPEIIADFAMEQLKEIDAQFRDSYLISLIVREVLQRADSNILFFEEAIELFKKAQSLVTRIEDYTVLEATQDVYANVADISRQVSEFVEKRTDTSKKRQFLREKIENVLRTKPFNLGRLGSFYSIVLGEKTYEVSYGIYAIYNAACSDKVNDFELSQIVNKTTSPVGCISAFFRAITGRSRSAETQAMYDQLANISNFQIPTMMVR